METHRRHLPAIWFRELDGTIHWRCQHCDMVLPTTTNKTPPLKSAWALILQEPCSRRKDETLPPEWRGRPSRHQLGYVTRQAMLGWLERTSGHGSAIPYERLEASSQDAEQVVGWAVQHFVLGMIRSWREGDTSEGELCRALGFDRLEWRGLANKLGLEQRP